MQIKYNPINYEARLVVAPKPSNKQAAKIKYTKNSIPKQGPLTKLMTIIVKPRLKNILKTPS